VLIPRLYYTAKPWLPPRLRLAVRRFHARRLLKRSTDTWPILESAGRTPDGWPGWPDNKQFAVVLTHDVEGSRGLDNVKPLAELEMSLGFRSAFYFIPEGSYTVPPALRHWLTDNGFEVGVHDLHHNGKLYRSRAHFQRCARRINCYLDEWQAVGFRSGFMLRQLDWLHDLEIQYDASTFDTDPFEPQPEGVNTIFPFWVEKSEVRSQESDVRDHTSQTHVAPLPLTPDHRPLPTAPLTSAPLTSDHRHTRGSGRGYVELPYTLPQDSTLFLLLRERSPAIWLRKLDWIAEHGGMALLNVHPDYMHLEPVNVGDSAYSVLHYRDFLKVVRTQYDGRFWSVPPSKLVRFAGSNSACTT
jgi:hypothetical protein